MYTDVCMGQTPPQRRYFAIKRAKRKPCRDRREFVRIRTRASYMRKGAAAERMNNSTRCTHAYHTVICGRCLSEYMLSVACSRHKYARAYM